MNTQTYNQHIQQPNVFNRGALELTFRLLRRIKPTLALQVQNLLAAPPLPKPSEIANSIHTDQFQIDPPAEVTRSIVETLSELAMSEAHSDNTDTGRLVMIRTLLIDWLQLAKTYLDDDESYQRSSQDNNQESEQRTHS